MFYLGKSGVPVPADAPYSAHLNEKQQWDFHQRKHQEALKSSTFQIDVSQPKSINPDAQSIQAHSRRFAVDARNAEIGRENRKLVDKLTTIAKSSGQCAPPGSLTGYGTGPQPQSMGAGCTMKQPPRPPQMPGGVMAPAASERARSLNDTRRRTTQVKTNQENASMVRRILSVRSTFRPEEDERSFQKHKRAVNNLQRLPGEGRKGPRSLPPLARRPQSYPTPVRGLESFMMPQDLQRSQSGPGSVGRQALTDSSPNLVQTAPAGSLPDPAREAGPPAEAGPIGSQTYSFGGFETFDSASGMEGSRSQNASASAAAPVAAPGSRGATPGSSREQAAKESPRETSSGGVSQNTLPRPAVGPGPEEEAGSAARGASAFGKRDETTDRRQWTEEDSAPPSGGAVGIAPKGDKDGLGGTAGKPAGGKMAMTGMSSVSELQYADEWDEYSFNSSGNVDASRSMPSKGMGDTGQSLRDKPSTGNSAASNDPPAAAAALPPADKLKALAEVSLDGSASAAGLGGAEVKETRSASGTSAPADPPPDNNTAPADDFSAPPDFGNKKNKRQR